VTHRLRAFLLTIYVLIPISLIVFSCKSTGDPYEQDLTEKEYFQMAIEASDSGNYRLAIRYYRAFQEKFPDDRDGNIWALYEIGFLHHKMGDDDAAVEFFDSLLAIYAESDGSEVPPLPEAPRILAAKVKENILAERETVASEAAKEE
jgi:outer membrane protein assembly factor BamD (BamD/ComL family)